MAKRNRKQIIWVCSFPICMPSLAQNKQLRFDVALIKQDNS